jgi:translocation and assembly module TamB
VLLNLDPTAQGFAYRAAGSSTLGPFTSRGAILLPAGQPAVIQVGALSVSGNNAAGTLRADPGGFTGGWMSRAAGLDGRLLFNPVGAFSGSRRISPPQRLLHGPPAIAIRRGRVDGVILLDPGATSLEGTLSARGLTSGGLSIASIEASGSLRGGVGEVRADVAGSRGRDFVFRTVANLAPGRIRLTGGGTVDRRPIQLSEPAVLTKEGDAWRLASTALTFAGGNATCPACSAPTTPPSMPVCRVCRSPSSTSPIRALASGGIASGTLSYRSPRGGAPPTGAADLRIRGLTRSGLVLSSKPVDVGVAARLQGGNAALRAIAVSEGRTIGRAQARISPIGTVGDIGERLSRAPLFAQLRYNGSADTLWRLTGVETIDPQRPVAVGADARGTLADPQIRARSGPRRRAWKARSPALSFDKHPGRRSVRWLAPGHRQLLRDDQARRAPDRPRRIRSCRRHRLRDGPRASRRKPRN